jgi:hypothetical protein
MLPPSALDLRSILRLVDANFTRHSHITPSAIVIGALLIKIVAGGMAEGSRFTAWLE